MRSSENSHTARRAKPSRNVTTAHGKYIGRVGALAVALGIGGAIATTPGVGVGRRYLVGVELVGDLLAIELVGVELVFRLKLIVGRSSAEGFLRSLHR